MTTGQFIAIIVTLILGFIGSVFTIIAYLTGRMDGTAAHLGSKVDSGFASVNTRFDDMRDLWRAELRRVEEVIDARLKHLEGE